VSEESDRKQREERELRVTDKRMFTAEGELREEYRHIGETRGGEAAAPAGGPPPREERAAAPPERPQPAPPAGPRGHAGAAPPSAQGSPGGAPVEIPSTGPGPEPQFLDLVALIAEPIALYLGDARLPDGRSVENLDAARLHIDLLDVLRGKTAGNLSAQESAVLEDVIYRFRMRYVQKRG
jgi:hypothetical protein